MTSILQRLVIQFLKWTEGGFNVLNMILKDLRISPLRNILTGISMFVGIIAMISSVLVGTLGKEYLISVNEGCIKLGGTDIREYKLDSLLSNISMVFQNVFLFADSIENNIKFGKPDATHEEVVRAAKSACCRSQQ